MSIVEVTTFRLAEGMSEEQFLELDKRFQTELVPNRAGFLRRTTARHGGEWCVVTLWWSEDDAAAFARDSARDPLRAEFDAALEVGTVHSTRYTTLD